jgi:hypothetical protein
MDYNRYYQICVLASGRFYILQIENNRKKVKGLSC